VNAAPLLTELGRALRASALDAVLIGNAAAALQGAPVTTVDFDFLFRKTPRNLQKLKAFARQLDAAILRPYYPVSDLFRVVRDDGLQVDFMSTIHGIRSIEGVKARATVIELGGVGIRVACLDDIIRSKKAAGRARDLAVIELLERTDAATRTEGHTKPPRPPRRPQARKRARPR